MNRDQLRAAIERKTAEVNAALAALHDLMGEATKAGLIVGMKLADVAGKPRQKTVAVTIADRIEVPQQQPKR
jgi:hypothetical protein